MVVSCRSLQCGQSKEAKTSIITGAVGLPIALALSISGVAAKQGSSRASARANRFILTLSFTKAQHRRASVCDGERKCGPHQNTNKDARKRRPQLGRTRLRRSLREMP